MPVPEEARSEAVGSPGARTKDGCETTGKHS